MQRYLDLSTRSKLFAAFALFVLFGALFITFSYASLAQLRDSQRTLYEVEMANVADLKDIRGNQLGIRADMGQLMLGGSAAQQETLRENIETRNRKMRSDLRDVVQRKGSMQARADQLREFEAIQDASIEFRRAQLLPMLAKGKVEEARELFNGVQGDRDRRLAALADELVDHAARASGAAVADGDRTAAEALRSLLLIAGVAALSGLALTLFLARVLASPLQVLSAAAERLAAGDLTVEVPEVARSDEAGVLSRAFRHMVRRLGETMREIGEGVNVLAASASEITASTAQVAASSAQTASAVAETSATAEEVKQTAQVASQKAAQVQDSADKTVAISQGGLKAMDDSIVAMQDIRRQMDSVAQSILRLADQGTAIGEIINTVNDLADQSNLLSVNASIEAARAGEEGAGFRIVAQEIRSLAEQSKQATVQVRALLGEIQKATSTAVMATEQAGKVVRSGVELSEGAAQSIRAMVTGIGESAQAAAQIAASAQQQSVGMDQVAYAMQSINQASVQNVAASRQTEAAAQNLQALGQRLKTMVAQYQS